MGAERKSHYVGSSPATATNKTFVCETPAERLVNSDFIIFDLRCLINYHQPRREARLFFANIVITKIYHYGTD